MFLKLPLADLEKLDYHTACNMKLHFVPVKWIVSVEIFHEPISTQLFT